jgi:hypothetical protein
VFDKVELLKLEVHWQAGDIGDLVFRRHVIPIRASSLSGCQFVHCIPKQRNGRESGHHAAIRGHGRTERSGGVIHLQTDVWLCTMYCHNGSVKRRLKPTGTQCKKDNESRPARPAPQKPLSSSSCKCTQTAVPGSQR